MPGPLFTSRRKRMLPPLLLKGDPWVSPVPAPGQPPPLACSLAGQPGWNMSRHNSCRGTDRHRQAPTPPTHPPRHLPRAPREAAAPPGPAKDRRLAPQLRQVRPGVADHVHTRGPGQASPGASSRQLLQEIKQTCVPAGHLATALCQGPGHGGQTAASASQRGTDRQPPVRSSSPPPNKGAHPGSATFSSEAGSVPSREHGVGAPRGGPPPQGET